MSIEDAIPKWAESLGAETWERINEALREGKPPCDVMRELKLPFHKRRSLEVHARTHYRNATIRAPLKRLSELLAGGALELGPDFLKVLRLAIEQAFVNPKVQPRLAGIMARFMGKMLELGAGIEEAAAKREHETSSRLEGQREELSREAIERIKAIYGLAGDGDDT